MLYPQNSIQSIEAFTKVLCDSDQGVNLMCGIKPLIQEVQNLGFTSPITSVKPSSIPLPRIPTYTPPLVVTSLSYLHTSLPSVSLPTS